MGTFRGTRPETVDPQNVAERFWRKVDRRGPDECWPWTAFRDGDGYGMFGLKLGSTNISRRAHRVAWALDKGLLYPPSNMFVCHRCDNPSCVNPAHLFLGTHTDNMQDRLRKGRNPETQKTHCNRGHEYSPENTLRTARGTRLCRTCNKMHCKAFAKARRERVAA